MNGELILRFVQNVLSIFLIFIVSMTLFERFCRNLHDLCVCRVLFIFFSFFLLLNSFFKNGFPIKLIVYSTYSSLSVGYNFVIVFYLFGWIVDCSFPTLRQWLDSVSVHLVGALRIAALVRSSCDTQWNAQWT